MQLYIKLYPDQLSRLPTVEAFVKGVWDLVGSGKMPAVADDAVR
jgi:exportin-2 (importin alpha re-exporter)